MANSTVTKAFLETTVVDQAPGAPTVISLNQTSNISLQTDVLLPTTDFDGSPLTGLTHLNIAEFAVVGGVDPTEGLTAEEIKVLPGVNLVVHPLTPTDAGTTVSKAFAFAHAGLQIVCAYWVDDN